MRRRRRTRGCGIKVHVAAAMVVTARRSNKKRSLPLYYLAERRRQLGS